MKMGSRTKTLYLRYPKKLGMRIPADSAIALTIKFGPFPM